MTKILSQSLTFSSFLSFFLSILLFSHVVLSTPLPSKARSINKITNTTTPHRLPIPNHQHRRLPTELTPNPSTTKATYRIVVPAYSNSIDPIPHDTYICYSGSVLSFPSSTAWISLSNMWTVNQWALTSGCAVFGVGEENTKSQLSALWDGIVSVADESGVDARFILAIVLQESNGCVNVPSTNNGIENNGIMQSFQGVTFVGDAADTAAQAASIRQMVVDGTQGTMTGFGLVQGVNEYGNVYDAARMYNSGSVNPANLNDPVGATASYVVDIANRMTGWVRAPRLSC